MRGTNQIGPKSKTRSKIKVQCSVGETSCGSKDNEFDSESGPEASVSSSSSKTKNARPLSTDESLFLTPERDSNLTDYGLEFTTRQLQPTPPGRRMEMTDVRSSQDELQSTELRSSLTGIRPQTQLQENFSNSKPTSLTAPKMSQQVAKNTNRRKRSNPKQRNTRFSKEVQRLKDRSFVIPLLTFAKLVRELINKYSTEITRITQTALEGLQTASEMYVTQRLQDAYMLTLHRGKVTLSVKDMQLLNFLKENTTTFH